MLYIPVPNTAEAAIGFNWVDQLVNMVLNFEFPGAVTEAVLTALADAIFASWDAHLQDDQGNDIALENCRCTDLTSASGASVIETPAAPIVGTHTGGSVNLNTAFVISHHTPLRGRSFRGRSYFPGFPDDAQENAGQSTDLARTSILADFVDFIDDIEAAMSCEHVVVSRFTLGAPRVTGVTTPITGYSANVDFDSQRRRLVGRGT